MNKYYDYSEIKSSDFLTKPAFRECEEEARCQAKLGFNFFEQYPEKKEMKAFVLSNGFTGAYFLPHESGNCDKCFLRCPKKFSRCPFSKKAEKNPVKLVFDEETGEYEVVKDEEECKSRTVRNYCTGKNEELKGVYRRGFYPFALASCIENDKRPTPEALLLDLQQYKKYHGRFVCIENGKPWVSPQRYRGTKRYNEEKSKSIFLHCKKWAEEYKNCYFLTLTAGSHGGVLESLGSWIKISNLLGAVCKKLNRKFEGRYVAVLESHMDGYAHAHMLFYTNFEDTAIKKRYSRAGKYIYAYAGYTFDAVKSVMGEKYFDLRPCTDGKAWGYISKYITKSLESIKIDFKNVFNMKKATYKDLMGLFFPMLAKVRTLRISQDPTFESWLEASYESYVLGKKEKEDGTCTSSSAGVASSVENPKAHSSDDEHPASSVFRGAGGTPVLDKNRTNSPDFDFWKSAGEYKFPCERLIYRASKEICADYSEKTDEELQNDDFFIGSVVLDKRNFLGGGGNLVTCSLKFLAKAEERRVAGQIDNAQFANLYEEWLDCVSGTINGFEDAYIERMQSVLGASIPRADWQMYLSEERKKSHGYNLKLGVGINEIFQSWWLLYRKVGLEPLELQVRNSYKWTEEMIEEKKKIDLEEIRSSCQSCMCAEEEF